MVMITNSFDKFPNEPTGSMYEQFGKTSNSPSSDEVGETSGTSESKTLGVTSSRYRGGIKIATGSALIGQTLSPTKGIKFELKRTGLSGVHSLSRFEIWNNETIISSATVTFQPDTKVGTSYAYVEFFPASTVTLQANDRITIATDGGVTNYYTFRSNASGTYDTTKTHWTESTYNAGSGGTWADDTGIDGNFKFTLVTQQPRVKQRFVEWFSGKQLPSYWTLQNNTALPTVAMQDSVDGGLLMTNTGTGTGGSITFNNKRQYGGSRNCTCIMVLKSTGGNTGLTYAGFDRNGYPSSSASSNSTAVIEMGASTYFNLVVTNAGSGWNRTATSIATADADWHNVKIDVKASDVDLTIDGTLEATRTGVRPTTTMQPCVNWKKCRI